MEAIERVTASPEHHEVTSDEVIYAAKLMLEEYRAMGAKTLSEVFSMARDRDAAAGEEAPR